MYASCRFDPWHNVLIPNDSGVTLFFRAVGDFAIRSRDLVNPKTSPREHWQWTARDLRAANLRITLDIENTRAHKGGSGRRRISPHCPALVRRAPVIQLRSPKWQI